MKQYAIDKTSFRESHFLYSNFLVSDTNVVLFKTRIHVFRNYYSSLLLVKKDTFGHYKIGLVSELGMKMMELNQAGRKFEIGYCFPALNKERVKQVIIDDFSSMFLLSYSDANNIQLLGPSNTIVFTPSQIVYPRDYCWVDTNARPEKLLNLKSPRKRNFEVRYSYDEKRNLSKIALRHYGLKRIKISLERLEN